jgi:hypothetical protein
MGLTLIHVMALEDVVSLIRISRQLDTLRRSLRHLH